MKSALSYWFEESDALIENRVALFDMIYLIFGVIYIILVVFFTILSYYREIGIVKGFLYNLFFTPLIGGIIVLSSYKSDDPIHIVTVYKCRGCKFEFTQYEEFCPICKKEGENIRLKRKTMEII